MSVCVINLLALLGKNKDIVDVVTIAWWESTLIPLSMVS
jgi:hypothetical protein